MDSGQDGNGFVGADGPNQFGGAPQSPIVSGGGMMPNRPVVSSGDVVLNSGGQKSNKGLKWVVGVIVGVLVVAGIGVGVWFGVGKNISEEESVETSFNKYANYFLYGDEKNSRIEGEYLEDNEVYFDDKVILMDSGDYMVKLKELFNDFYDRVVKNEVNNVVQDFLNEYKNKLQLVVMVYDNEPFISNQIFELYLADGGGGDVLGVIMDEFASYKDIGEIYGYSYYDLALSYGKTALALIENYSSLGCIVGSEIDYDCVYIRSNESTDEILGRLSEYSFDMRFLRNISIKDLSKDIYQLAKYVYSDRGEESEE